MWKPLISHLKNRGIHVRNYLTAGDDRFSFILLPMQVYFWVCNDIDEFAQCNKLGATGCMTDRPTLLREYLDTKSTE